MNQYSSYKDSGVEWIGEIPSSYSLLPIKYILKDIVDNRGRTPELKDRGIPYVEVKHVNVNGKYPTENTDRFVSIDTYNNFLRNYLKEGDVLYSTVGTLGRTSIIPKNFNGCIIQNVIGFRTNEKCDSTFFYYVLNSEYGQHLIYDVVRGNIQGSVKVTDFIQQKIITPPLSEQKQIVSFLDTKTSLTDSLIEKTQRKIELLKEKRTSLINQVVTKGLNPNVEMKDSGVEWIGEIPSGWEKSKLKYKGVFFSGYSFDSNDFLSEGHIRVLKISNIQNNGISWDDLQYLPESFYQTHQNFNVIKGDLVFVLTRPIISSGIKVCFFDEEYKTLLNQRNSVFRPNESSVIKRFLFYSVRTFSFIEEFKQQLKETNQPNISTEQISNILMFFPPLSEQQEIVSYLDKETKLIDETISSEQKKIELLKEYKQSLISEVVTGKRKVTNDE